MLRATVRYFSFGGAGPEPSRRAQDQAKPSLPADVAALVDELKPGGVGVELVNLNRNETRKLIVQSGAFGEHRFTEIKYRDGDVLLRLPMARGQDTGAVPVRFDGYVHPAPHTLGRYAR